MLGADVSSVQRTLDLGGKYFDAAGVARDPLDILKSIGVNYVRLRVWNNPASGYNNKAKVLAYAKVVKAKGLRLLIDFHYSDTWADPGKQVQAGGVGQPTGSASSRPMCTTSRSTCAAASRPRARPRTACRSATRSTWACCGNDGKVVNNNFTNLGLLLKAGFQGHQGLQRRHPGDHPHRRRRQRRQRALVLRRDHRAGRPPGTSRGCRTTASWHGSLSNLSSVITGRAVALRQAGRDRRDRVPVHGRERRQPGQLDIQLDAMLRVPATWAGQADEFTAVQNTARSAGALGVFYWEPTWFAISGNGWDPANINGTGDEWDNMAVFNWTGNLNPTCGGRPEPGSLTTTTTSRSDHVRSLRSRWQAVRGMWPHAREGGSKPVCRRRTATLTQSGGMDRPQGDSNPADASRNLHPSRDPVVTTKACVKTEPRFIPLVSLGSRRRPCCGYGRRPWHSRSQVVDDARKLRGARRGKETHNVGDLLRLDHVPHQLLMAALVAEPGLRLGLHERDDAVGACRRRMHGHHAYAVLARAFAHGAGEVREPGVRRGPTQRTRTTVARPPCRSR